MSQGAIEPAAQVARSGGGVRQRLAQGVPVSWRPLLAVLILTAVIRGALITCHVIDFNSDEAVIDLMARHITQGRWPTFYYGAAYVGSLGATVIAAAFALMGESVVAGRVVQAGFYVGTVLFTCLLARRILGKAAVASGLLLASPPVMVTLYTSSGIGAYGETLLFGALLLWLGHKLAHEWQDKWPAWLAWGCVAGLGFWSLGLIVVYIVPVGILWLLNFDRKRWPGYLLVAAGFLACSSPWWIYDLTHDHAAFHALIGSSTAAGVDPLPVGQKWAALFLLGVPALIGARFPWQAGYILLPAVPLVVAFYALVLVGAWRHGRRLAGRERQGALLIALLGAGFLLFFAVSGFAPDVTGRYLLPLYPLLCITAGGWWAGLSQRTRRWGSLALAAILAFNLAGVVLGAAEPAGLTTVYFPEQQIGNAHDEALIDFLQDQHLERGYSHHWVAYKIAFLSGEQVILAPLLPYVENVPHDPAEADRYPPYTALARSTASPVYVTSNQPWLDGILRQRLEERGVHFEEADVGPYHVFYGLSAAVSPIDLGAFSGGDE